MNEVTQILADLAHGDAHAADHDRRGGWANPIRPSSFSSNRLQLAEVSLL